MGTAVKTLLSALATLLYGWIVAARDLWYVISDICRRSRARKRRGPKSRNRCVPISDPAFVRPDPLIYDQYYLTSLGLSVTWDNPDIQLYLNGSQVSSTLISPGTTYEIVAQIWNNSTDAPVVAMPVAFSFLEFGVGTISVPIGSTQVDLGVKGSPGCPAFATMPWTTPTTPGHYCIQVLLEPVDDINVNNNLGQENTNVGTAHSPALFTPTLRNDTLKTQGYKFEVDTYDPGAPDPCDGANDATARAARLTRHRRGSNPVPAGWHVEVDPEAPSLAPGESIPLTVTVTPPTGFTGDLTFNVNAFHAGGLAGGVTLTVTAA
jgi:NPCBM-associated, NEW3 domain of alpha-galactosidase